MRAGCAVGGTLCGFWRFQPLDKPAQSLPVLIGHIDKLDSERGSTHPSNRRNRGEVSRFVGEEQFQLKRSARLDDGAAFHPASTHGEVPEGPFPFSSYDIYG